MALAMTLQYFDLEMRDPQYTLTAKQGLTQKPTGFQMRAKLRAGISALSVEQSIVGLSNGAKPAEQGSLRPSTNPSKMKPLAVLYGSNCGTCEAFARTIATDAPAHGFKVSQLGTLDSVKVALPTDQPVVIVTASYEGQPCDNATHFYRWLETLPDR